MRFRRRSSAQSRSSQYFPVAQGNFPARQHAEPDGAVAGGAGGSGGIGISLAGSGSFVNSGAIAGGAGGAAVVVDEADGF